MPNTTIVLAIAAIIGIATGALGTQQQDTAPIDRVLPLEPMLMVPKMESAKAPAHPHEHHGHLHSIEEDRKNHGKPGADVYLQGLSYFSLDANVAEEIELKLKAETGKGTLHVQLQGHKGLALTSQSEWQFEVGENTEFTIQATLFATANGEHALNIFTTFVDQYGNVSARAMAVAAQVGVLMVDKHHYKHNSEIAGPSFVSLAAKESIR